MKVIGRRIVLDTGQAITNQNELTEAVKSYKDALKGVQFGSKSYQDINKQLGLLTATQRQLRKETRQAGDEQLGAYRKLSIQLSKAKAEYKDLVIEGKKSSDRAKELIAEIGRVDSKLKSADKQVGEFFRNVGNYEGAVSKAYSKLRKDLTSLKGTYRNLIAEGKENTKEAKEYLRQIQKLGNKIDGIDRKSKAALSPDSNAGKGFKSIIGSSALAVGGVAALGAGVLEAGRKFISFSKDAYDLSRSVEGVNYAFDRVVGGAAALEATRAATRGLLSDIDIKKSIVEFDNFNISQKETATLFEFLAVRSKQTGQSIDDLKSSLVEGLSKKSKERIDNLGISTEQLNEELKKTPDFVQAVANIAAVEIAEAGDILDSAGGSQEAWNKQVENFTVLLGNAISESGQVQKFFSFITAGLLNVNEQMQEFGAEGILNALFGGEATAERSAFEITKFLTPIGLIDDTLERFGSKSLEERLFGESDKEFQKAFENIKSLQKEIKTLDQETLTSRAGELILELSQERQKTGQDEVEAYKKSQNDIYALIQNNYKAEQQREAKKRKQAIKDAEDALEDAEELQERVEKSLTKIDEFATVTFDKFFASYNKIIEAPNLISDELTKKDLEEVDTIDLVNELRKKEDGTFDDPIVPDYAQFAIDKTNESRDAEIDKEIEATEKLKKQLKEKADLYKEYASAVGETLGALITGNEEQQEAALKNLGKFLLDTVEKNLIAAIPSIFINNTATPQNALSGGIYGPIKSAAMIALVKAAFSAVKGKLLAEDGVSISPDGVIQGARHYNGGIPMRINGVPVEAEGGEFFDYDEFGNVMVINRRSTTAFRDVLASLRGQYFNGKGSMLSEINKRFGGAKLAEDGISIPSAGSNYNAIYQNVLKQQSFNYDMLRKAVRDGANEGTNKGITTASERSRKLNDLDNLRRV